jgi:hypothetical protein
LKAADKFIHTVTLVAEQAVGSNLVMAGLVAAVDDRTPAVAYVVGKAVQPAAYPAVIADTVKYI